MKHLLLEGIHAQADNRMVVHWWWNITLKAVDQTGYINSGKLPYRGIRMASARPTTTQMARYTRLVFQ